MLSNRLRVDVFEIPLHKKKMVGSLQREKFLSRQTHLAAGWPSVSVLVRRSTKASSASDGGVGTSVGRVRLDLWLEA